MAAATPGRSATPVTVILASDVSGVTDRMMGCSMVDSSFITQVPCSQVNADRMCSLTP